MGETKLNTLKDIEWECPIVETNTVEIEKKRKSLTLKGASELRKLLEKR